MFGFLKGLFSKPASVPPAVPEAVPAASPPSPPPPARTPAAAAPPSSVVAPAPLAIGGTLLLPLDEILALLPESVAQLVLSRPGGTFSLPASTAVEQLRSGAVRVPFGQLRQGSPAGTFADDASVDDSLIDLPLPLVLAALGPSMLSRRTDQRHVDVPDEVTGVFDPRHPVPTISAPAGAPPATTPAPAPMPAPVPAAPTPPPPPSQPQPQATKPILPASPPPWQKPAVPTVPSYSLPKPAAPSPGLPKPLTSITHDLTKPRPAAPPLPFAAKRPASPAPQAAAPVVVAEPVVTTVGALCETWPEAVRQEIDKTDTRNASVSIPLSRLEAAMKAGRVVFAWSELRGWLNPPPAGEAALGETQG